MQVDVGVVTERLDCRGAVEVPLGQVLERELAAGRDFGESLGFRANATGGANLDVIGHSTALLVEGHVLDVRS